jgi:hypothetical protein
MTASRTTQRVPRRHARTRSALDTLVRVRWYLAAAALVVLAVLVIGGYGLGWRWTGLSSSVTLWDWLQALALPVALGTTPLLLKHRRRLHRRHYLAISAGLAAFALLVLAGYLWPLGWTGFTGNTLWDWLELLLLPLVVATTSLWSASAMLRRPYLSIGLAALTVFVVLVISGYLVPLTWTGFRGNTAWDWIKLLLVPALVPTVLVPFVTRELREHLAPDTEQAPETQPGRSRTG